MISCFSSGLSELLSVMVVKIKGLSNSIYGERGRRKQCWYRPWGNLLDLIMLIYSHCIVISIINQPSVLLKELNIHPHTANTHSSHITVYPSRSARSESGSPSGRLFASTFSSRAKKSEQRDEEEFRLMRRNSRASRSPQRYIWPRPAICQIDYGRVFLVWLWSVKFF